MAGFTEFSISSQGVTVMRCMAIVKASKDSEAGVMPSQQLLADMGRFNEELAKAGVLLAGEGRQKNQAQYLTFDSVRRHSRPGHSPQVSRSLSKEKSVMFKVNPIPAGMHTVTPHLVCAGAAEAIEFYKKAFGAVELMRLPGRQGRLMHACILIGDSPVMLVDEMPEWGSFGPKSLKGSPVTIHLFVENVDAVMASAVNAGAKVTMPVADMFWGDRYGKVEDPFGHYWSVATHMRDLSPQEIQREMAKL
jgi:uncharacterized glyoxalase superfamily protein PhnB